MPTPVRVSLIRDQLWAGGDRRLVGVSALLAGLMAWMLINSYGVFVGAPVGLVVWSIGVWIARQMAAADPKGLDVWRRHNRYKPFYPARAHRDVEVPMVKDFL